MENINPDTINKKKNTLVKNYIKDLIERKELYYEDMLKFLTKCIEDKDFEEAMIWIYYINNVLLKKKDVDDEERNTVISAMINDVKKIK